LPFGTSIVLHSIIVATLGSQAAFHSSHGSFALSLLKIILSLSKAYYKFIGNPVGIFY
jgi:hypothetical protein